MRRVFFSLLAVGLLGTLGGCSHHTHGVCDCVDAHGCNPCAGNPGGVGFAGTNGAAAGVAIAAQPVNPPLEGIPAPAERMPTGEKDRQRMPVSEKDRP